MTIETLEVIAAIVGAGFLALLVYALCNITADADRRAAQMWDRERKERER